MGELSLVGRVTVVQETRFWLLEDGGRAFLLVAGDGDPSRLLSLEGRRVRVRVEGDVDAVAVATRIEPWPPE